MLCVLLRVGGKQILVYFSSSPLKTHALSPRPRHRRTRCPGRCCRRRPAPCPCHGSRPKAGHRPSGRKRKGTGHTKEGRPSVPEIPKTAPKYVWTSLNHHMKKRKVQNLPPPNLLKDVNTMLAPCMPCMCAMCVCVVYSRQRYKIILKNTSQASTFPVKSQRNWAEKSTLSVWIWAMCR